MTFPNDRALRLSESGTFIEVIDQRLLPHELKILSLHTEKEVIDAIQNMVVRGAPLIGVTAAYGVYIASLAAPTTNYIEYFMEACERIRDARPTAVNLRWAVDRVKKAAGGAHSLLAMQEMARDEAAIIESSEVENCLKIGEYGVQLIREMAQKKNGSPVNILTHCNAGWLACVAHGTATAPIYEAQAAGIPIHVWVDETRPLNQGARLTAWELHQAGVNHTVVVDNAGGHLMQRGLVDMIIVGTDRTTHTGDVANKIGTYLKALAAKDNHIPFYVALPSSTFDWSLKKGLEEIPIEERNADEVHYVQGLGKKTIQSVRVTPLQSEAANPAFDVTPARLVTAFITERGICKASEEGIRNLFKDK